MARVVLARDSVRVRVSPNVRFNVRRLVLDQQLVELARLLHLRRGQAHLVRGRGRVRVRASG